MCDPVTVSLFAVIGATLGASASVYSGIQKSKAEKYEAQVNRNNAVYADRAAADAKERGQRALVDHYRQVSALEGEQRARGAAAGLDTGYGTPLDLMTDTRVLGAADATVIADNTAKEAEGYRISASGYRDQVRMNKRAAQTALVVGALDAGSTLLSSASQMGGMGGAPKRSGTYGPRA